MKRVLVVLTFALVLLGPSSILAQTLPGSSVFVIAKSTTIYAMENPDDTPEKGNLQYVPNGTRMLAYEKRLDFIGKKRRLVLTEHGLWGYIIDTSDDYWGPRDIQSFVADEQIGFVTKKFEAKIPLGGGTREFAIVLTLTRGEIYKVVDQSEETVTLRPRDSDLSSFRKAFVTSEGQLPNISFEMTIPKENVQIVDFRLPLKTEDASAFSASIVNGIAGIEKNCDTKQATAFKVSEEAGFSLDKFFLSLGLTQSAEIEKTEEFGDDVSVLRRYFTRSERKGVYKVTRIQSCSGTQAVAYRVVNPDGAEITVNEEWVKGVNQAANNEILDTDSRTGEVVVSCANQYFSYADELATRGFAEDEIPFIIWQSSNRK